MKIKACIITIGNEILSGSTLDTNSFYIAQEFNKIGIEIVCKFTISDTEKSIKKALNQAFKKANIVITTGGLGPTSDDITKQIITDYFKDKLILNQDVLKNIEDIFSKLNRTVNQLNRNQALVPSKAKIIHNNLGTAPGIYISEAKKTLIALPGVPYEMKNLLCNHVIKILQKDYDLPFIITKTIIIQGIPESILAEKLQNWQENLSEKINVSYLPSGNIIKLKLTRKGKNQQKIEAKLNKETEKISRIIGENIRSVKGILPLEEFIDIIKEKNITISLAESCTGGMLSQKIVSVPDVSSFYKGSITCYSNEVKQNILGISDSIITNSVVSKECAEQMARNIATKMNTNFAISTTGIAGPNSDYSNTKIGTAFIGIFYNNKTFHKEFFFPFLTREEFMDRICIQALMFSIEIINQSK